MTDFDFLVLMLRADAEVHLGMYPQAGGEGEQKPEPNLPLARKIIDTLAMLQDKTKGNLSLEEKRQLDNTVTELRFRYLQVFETQQKKAAEEANAKS